MAHITRHLKRFFVEGLGWLLVVVGIAALVLPGPGLLAIFAGMALLATQYDWAERRLEPVKKAAFKTAAESVSSPLKIVLSVLFCIALIALGIFWSIQPHTPDWWSLPDKLWLPGGITPGVTLIASGLIAAMMIAYSYKKFRPGR